MNNQTANLQTPSVKQLATLMNVSERAIYMARKVGRLRPDLIAEIDAGKMSVNEAHRIATGKAKPTSWDRLVTAWNNASEDDQARLALAIFRAERGEVAA